MLGLQGQTSLPTWLFKKLCGVSAYGSHAQNLNVTSRVQMIKKKGKKPKPLSHMTAGQEGEGGDTGRPGAGRSQRRHPWLAAPVTQRISLRHSSLVLETRQIPG